VRSPEGKRLTEEALNILNYGLGQVCSSPGVLSAPSFNFEDGDAVLDDPNDHQDQLMQMVGAVCSTEILKEVEVIPPRE
jgi:hypothetical protein